MGKTRTNPRRRPATYADISRAKKKAQRDALDLVTAMFLTVLHDKEGYGQKRLIRVWNHMEYLSDSIVKGYVTANDLLETLKEEAGIFVHDEKGV